MIVRIFDDKRSYFHTIFGFLSYFFPYLTLIFVTYEFAEFELIHDRLAGDLCEFSLGLMLASIVSIFVSIRIPR